MVDERPELAASEIEAVLRAALQKLPSLRSTQSVRFRPYSGPEGWTWALDKTAGAYRGRRIPTATPASPVCCAPACRGRQFKRRQAQQGDRRQGPR
jgi:hypothetical protein